MALYFQIALRLFERFGICEKFIYKISRYFMINKFIFFHTNILDPFSKLFGVFNMFISFILYKILFGLSDGRYAVLRSLLPIVPSTSDLVLFCFVFYYCMFYQLLCVPHSSSSTQSWGSVLPSIVETRDQNSGSITKPRYL